MSAAAPSPASAFRLVGAILNDIAHALHSPDHPDERITTVLHGSGESCPTTTPPSWRTRRRTRAACSSRRSPPPPTTPCWSPRCLACSACSESRRRPRRARSRSRSPARCPTARTSPCRSSGSTCSACSSWAGSSRTATRRTTSLLLSIVASQLGAYLTARHLGAENRRLYEETRGANAAKDDFLITLSHELRTPLNAITGWTRLLRDHPLDAGQARHALEVVDRSARTLTQLLDDLLDVSRIISGKLRLEARLFHLHPVVETALDAVRDVAEKKGVEIRSTLDFGVGPILGDPERVQQIVWNLLSNAIKYTPAGKPITWSFGETRGGRASA